MLSLVFESDLHVVQGVVAGGRYRINLWLVEVLLYRYCTAVGFGGSVTVFAAAVVIS